MRLFKNVKNRIDDGKEHIANRIYDKVIDRIEQKFDDFLNDYIITFESDRESGQFSIVGKKKA